MGRNRVFPEKTQGSGKKRALKTTKAQERPEIGESSRRPFKKSYNKSGNKKSDVQANDTEHISKNPDKNNQNNFFLQSNSALKAKRTEKDHHNTKNDNTAKINKTFSKIAKQNVADGVSQTSKKTFDKKKYRLQKYSKKYRVEQWEDKRKKAVLREYYRTVKDEPKLDVSQIYKNYDSDSGVNSVNIENENNLNSDNNVEIQIPETSPTQPKKGKKKHFKKAAEEFQRIKETSQMKQKEFLQKKAEQLEAIKKLKKEKAEKYRKLSRKTKKGQPIMKERMEMLLEKIQKMT